MFSSLTSTAIVSTHPTPHPLYYPPTPPPKDYYMLVSERRMRFRDYLARDGCVRPASVFDAMSARLAEAAGFEIGMLAGSIASAVAIGAPDWTLITLTEFADQARRITRASDISLMVDADHGYGNALNVMRTVEEMENAGVSALTIEDTVLPAPFASGPDLQLISIPEMTGKLNAALRARRDESLVIIGRSIAGPDSVVERARAYAKLGVDALFFTGISTIALLEEVRKAAPIPLLTGSSSPELDDLDRLASVGVRIAQKGHLPIRAAIKALFDTYKAQKSGLGAADLKGTLAPEETMSIALGQDTYDQWKQEFLT